MSRIIAVDYGAKRCGVAATDILQISINPLEVLPPESLLDFLAKYIGRETVATLVIGWPRHRDGEETYLVKEIKKFLSNFAKLFPEITIEKVDEAYSSSEAKSLIFESGAKKKKRRDRSLIDQMSAVILLKRYLEGE